MGQPAISIVFFAISRRLDPLRVQELMHVNRKFGLPVLVTWMLLLGLFLGRDRFRAPQKPQRHAG
jgi:hypothetical protein